MYLYIILKITWTYCDGSDIVKNIDVSYTINDDHISDVLDDDVDIDDDDDYVMNPNYVISSCDNDTDDDEIPLIKLKQRLIDTKGSQVRPTEHHTDSDERPKRGCLSVMN